jgi:hypothetical protein
MHHQEIKMGYLYGYRKRNKDHHKAFRNTNICTSFRTTNTMKNHLTPKKKKHIKDTFNKCSIHQLKCNDCPLKIRRPNRQEFPNMP